MTAIFRYAVPVDDKWHEIALTRIADLDLTTDTLVRSAPILHVDCRDPAIVEFWCEQDTDEFAEREARRFRVFGTGQPVRGDYRGTAMPIAAGGRLVWHLYEAAR